MVKIASWIRMGRSRDYIMARLTSKEFGYNETAAKNLIGKCVIDVRDKYDLYINDVREHNIQQLMAIIDEAYDAGKYTDAISAIDKLNKMAGVYEEKINLKTNSPVFKIVLDSDSDEQQDEQ